MFNFPENLYTDVRIEEVCETKISISKGVLTNFGKTSFSGAFVRVFDGKKWFLSSVDEVENIQKTIDRTASLAVPSSKIDDNPVVKKLEVNKGVFFPIFRGIRRRKTR